jgi:membrane-bound lytic murein transglycosylase D
MRMKKLIYVIPVFMAIGLGLSVTARGIPLGEELAITNPPPKPDTKDEPTENNPTVNTEEDTPVVLENMDVKPDELGKRPWTKPNYADQKDVLGYSTDTFKVPEGLEPQVNFWTGVFGKYSTDQGILHDSRYINIVYEELDFKKIEKYETFNPVQRQKAREHLVKDKKKEIIARLKFLQSVTDPATLQGEDLRVWKLFEGVDEKKKFSEAAERGRLRFQLGLKDRFIQGIYYSGRYLQKMEQVFREAGLPIELTRLPFVESSFNLKARSKVGASGIWQFMRHTGRIYMKVNGTIDERNEPLIATAAAARLLKFNYNLVQSWPLAVTAYNFGPSGMKREKDKWKTDNLVEIAQKSTNRHFGFASSNFYASFLAALEVERNADKYFGQVDWSNPVDFDEVVLPRPVRYGALLEHFGGDTEKALLYNPHFTKMINRGYVALPKGAKIRVPKLTAEKFMASLERMPAKQESKAIRTGVTEYKVSTGDTLSSIAKDFGVAINDIRDINGIGNPRALRVGQTLQIPVTGQ